MVAIPEVAEFMSKDKRQLILGLDLIQQTFSHDNQPAWQCHRIGHLGIVDLYAKFVWRVLPVKREPVHKQLRLLQSFISRRNGYQVLGQPVLEEISLFLNGDKV